MDVEEPNKVVAASGTQTSVAVSVHPLVIMNVSEHWTRMRAQNNNTAMQVFGALLGKQRGRNLELMNSFEVRWDVVEGRTVLDLEFFRTRESQCSFYYYYYLPSPYSPGFFCRQGSVYGVGFPRMVYYRRRRSDAGGRGDAPADLRVE